MAKWRNDIYRVQKLFSFWKIEMIKTKSKRKKHWSSPTIQSTNFFFGKIKDHLLNMCGCLIITLNHQSEHNQERGAIALNVLKSSTCQAIGNHWVKRTTFFKLTYRIK